MIFGRLGRTDQTTMARRAGVDSCIDCCWAAFLELEDICCVGEVRHVDCFVCDHKDL